MPPAAPRNMPGKVGPPLKLLRDTPYASPLHTRSRMRVPTENVALFSSSEGSDDCPEKSTREEDLPVASAKI